MSIMEAMKYDIASLGFGEKMVGALITMVLGIATCFVVLAILIVCITIMSKAFGTAKKKEPVPVPAAAPAAQAPAAPKAEDDAELVAVLAAAIEAFTGNRNFTIKNITEIQTPPALTSWMSAARAEAYASRNVIIKK